MFCGTRLEFSQEVIHLGHTLFENLDDPLDISRDLLHRAHYILCTFSFADPFVQSMLIKSFCLSLSGSQLRNLCNKSHLQIVYYGGIFLVILILRLFTV